MFEGGETLEDSLLTSNVPGRYSKWDKNDDSGPKRRRGGRGDDDDGEDCQDGKYSSRQSKYEENDEPDGYRSNEEDTVMKAIDDKRKAQEERVPEGIRHAIQRGERPGARTGAKGVLADYKAFKVAEYEQIQHKKRQREAILKRLAEGAREEVPSASSQAMSNLQQSHRHHNINEDEEDEEDDNDDFMLHYRRQRLLEMQASSNMPVSGEIQEASAFEFVDIVNQADPRVKVVVHIYEPYIKACSTLNKYLETLARKYTHVKFLRLLASAHPKKDLDEIALPMLAIYHKGQVVDCVARVHEEFGDTFVVEDMEWLLENKGVLAIPATSKGGSIAVAAAGIGSLYIDDADDR